MRHWLTWWIVLMLSAVALSGCSGKEADDGGSEPSAADAIAKAYDRAIGNHGHRVTGSLTGPAAEVGADSAVQLDILDVAPKDTDPPQDKATLILDAKEAGLNVQGTMRSMASGATANATADHFSGVAQNVKIFGTTGVGPNELPEATAYLFAVGFANLKVGDAVQSKRLVYVAVTDALRDEAGAPLATADSNNLQMHVIVPGATMGLQAVDGVPGGFLYYYFEEVGLSKMSDEDRGKVGSGLAAPEKKNLPPVANGKILVDGKTATTAVQQNKSNENVTVQFDASGSTDSDGSVTRWVWRVFELTNVTYEKATGSPQVVQGEKVTYLFTKAGPKLINLTVVDNQGGTHTIVLNLYVDFQTVLPGGGSTHSQGPVAYPDCSPPVNCFEHVSIIEPGIVSATYTVAAKGDGVVLQGIHVDIYAPGKDSVGTDTPIKESDALDDGTPFVVAGADFKGSGRFKVVVWYEGSTSAGGQDHDPTTPDGIYELGVKAAYTPKV